MRINLPFAIPYRGDDAEITCETLLPNAANTAESTYFSIVNLNVKSFHVCTEFFFNSAFSDYIILFRQH